MELAIPWVMEGVVRAALSLRAACSVISAVRPHHSHCYRAPSRVPAADANRVSVPILDARRYTLSISYRQNTGLMSWYVHLSISLLHHQFLLALVRTLTRSVHATRLHTQLACCWHVVQHVIHAD